jgi:hypothetical protein
LVFAVYWERGQCARCHHSTVQYTLPVRFLSNCSRDSDWAGCVTPLLNSHTEDREFVRKTAVLYFVATSWHRYSKIKGEKKVTGNGRHRLASEGMYVNRVKNFRRLSPELGRIGSAQLCHFWA